MSNPVSSEAWMPNYESDSGRRGRKAEMGTDDAALGDGLREVSVPKPEPGEVLVEVAAVALNYLDRMVTESGRGLPLAFPFTRGSDLAETAAALGDDVTRFDVGNHVISTITPRRIAHMERGLASDAVAECSRGRRFRRSVRFWIVDRG